MQAYREGSGVPYPACGRDLVEGQAAMNRAMFLCQLGAEWLPRIPDLHRRLKQRPPARVADIGCGVGWSSIGLARTYPQVRVNGFDLDKASVKQARANARETGLSHRVRFHVRDAADPNLEGKYQLVTAFESLHDMSDPVAALNTMARLAGRDGTVLVVDERVGDQLTAAGQDLEWMMYGWSLLHCLPVGMSGRPSAETGTVMRVGTLRNYARKAGFRRVEVLPIEHPFFRFYRLHLDS